MGKEKKEKKDKKEKKEAKSKSPIEDPVADSSHKVSKKDKKKDKKDKKSAVSPEAASALLDSLAKKEDGEGTSSGVTASTAVGEASLVDPSAAEKFLVPFAKPLANEKQTKKVLKTVKKAARNKAVKRGVKEVVKALRKSPTGSSAAGATAVVVLAADISPMDVISHIPVLCEEHNVPYIFVTSRAELGAAGSTKRPTSVVMIVPGMAGKKDKKKKKDEDKMETDDDGDDGFKEAYDDLVKLIEAATA